MNAAPQFTRRKAGTVDLTLPFPPSMNSLWRKSRNSVYRSPRYMSWLNAAGMELNIQKPGCILGNYVMVLQLERKDKRRRDAANFEKAVSDLLVAHGVLRDDSLAESVTIMWSPTVKGCRVIVTEEANDARQDAAVREVPFG